MDIISFLFSTRRNVYREIARTYNCTALHVYRLAHGKKLQSVEDHSIANSLINKGIVSGKKVQNYKYH